MKDPNRWRDPNGGADAETRALLQNPPLVSPSRREADEIWAGLSAHLDVTFTPPGPDGSQLGPTGPVHGPQMVPVAAAAGAAGAGALAGKATLAVVLLATVGGVVGTRVISSREQHARAVAPKTARAEVGPSLPSAAPPIVAEPLVQRAPTIPQDTQPEIRPRPEKTTRSRAALGTTPTASMPVMQSPPPVAEHPLPAPTLTPPVVLPRTGSMVEEHPLPAPTLSPPVAHRTTGSAEPALISVNELLEEGRRLDRVRRALRAHDPDLALHLLGEESVRTNELAQEREALTIEAEAAQPALRAKAVERASVFLRVYPHSPYRARIQGLISGSE